MRKLRTVLQHTLVSALVAALTVGPAALGRADVVQKAGGNTAVGAVVPTRDPNNSAIVTGWNVTVPNGAIVHYSSFDVAAGQVVTFMNQNTSGGDVRVLNRILSKTASNIDGTITGSGGNFFLYFVNPAGVVFGPNSQVVGNIASLEAVGGHLSDKDFNRGTDHFTGVKGRVSNAGEITANAVALVGGQVANSGDVIAEGGWIVMAAGNDVLIGRDSANQGVLLRVEGAANAVFNKNATGVSNTGTLTATATAANPGAGNVSLGAGDLYGTAIFSNKAIEARKLALSADNKGDIALGGTVQASELDVTQLGDKTGQLKGTGGASNPTTINADTVSLQASAAKGDVRVGAGLAFRDTANDGHGPGVVTVDQQHSLTTANLSGLDLGKQDDVARAALSLSSAGSVTVTDKKLVDGTDLTLSGPGGVDLQGADTLDVHTLNISATSTISDGDITVRGPDIPSGDPSISPTPAFSISGNLQFKTPDVKPTDPSPVITLLSLGGTLGIKGDITTTNGGTLRLDGQNIQLGSFDPITGAVGGNIDISGSVQPKLEIGFADPTIPGSALPTRVELTAINTQGAQHHASDPPQPGGDVAINATGDILIHGAITTMGQASGKKNVPNEPGGRVEITTSGGDITVGTVTTGGADAPAAGSTTPEPGAISLSAPNANTITLQGALDTRGGSVGNDKGQRDRSIDLLGAGTVTLNADSLTISGGDVTFDGQLINGQKLAADGVTPIDRSVDLTINSSGVTTLERGAGTDALSTGGSPLHSIGINSQGGDVLFGGDVNAVTEVAIGFATSGVGHWGTTPGSSGVSVNANQVLVTSSVPSNEVATTASVKLDSTLHFRLDDIPDPNDPNAPTRGNFTLRQDAGLDAATLDSLFTPGRFATVVDKTIDLESHATVAFDSTAANGVQGSNLIIVGNDFNTDSPLSVASLDLTTLGALDASFSVTATNPSSSIILQAGANGTGDLNVTGTFNGDDITLIAGDDTGNATTAKVVVSDAATFRDHTGTADASRVTIRQDADFATADLPNPSVFGSDFSSRATPFQYQLESRDGTITLSAGADAKVAGSALSLFGEQGIDLGTSVPLLASLAARTPAALDIENPIKTMPNGSIELRSGLGGSGDLTINAELDSSKIDLFAGSNDGKNSKARVLLESGARFASDTDPAKAPGEFSFNQDAAIGTANVPGTSFFAGAALPSAFGLSSSGNLTVDAAQVDGTGLSLVGKAVTVSGDLLNLSSLDVTGAVSFDGSVTSAGHIVLNGNTNLTGTSSSGSAGVAQTLTAGGDFDLTGKLTKTQAGKLTVSSGGSLTTGDVTTAHSGGAVELDGTTSVTAGKIDASAVVSTGIVSASSGGAVTIQSSGAVVVGSVNTRGSAGSNESKGVAPGKGTDAGAISISGQTITTGALTSTGGAGGTTLSQGSLHDSTGGAGADITLTAAGGISLSGNLLADGGAGSPNSGTTSPSALDGQSGNVTVRGPLSLLTDTSSGSAGNAIHGNQVEIDGPVGPGTPSGGTQLLAANTGLIVRADQSLALGGDVNAGSVDLEVHTGALALGARTISADTIRLAASDGVGGHTDGVVDLSGLTFTGSNGAGPVASFTLDQDAAIGGAGSPIPSLSLFAGNGTALTRPFALGLVSEDGDIQLGAADVANFNSSALGTALTLAAGAANVAGDTTPHIFVSGADLTLPSLQLGTAAGAKGRSVGGNAQIDQSLSLGTSTGDLADVVLTSIGSLTVGGSALFRGSSQFNGTVDQTVAAKGGALDIEGFNTEKTGAGKLALDAAGGLQLASGTQTISSDVGPLELSSGLKTGITKQDGALQLFGTSPDGTTPGVAVTGGVDANGIALETLTGDLTVSASAPASSSTSGPRAGPIQLDGGASANGNLTLGGALILEGGQQSYTFSAKQNSAVGGSTSGVLTSGGIASSDGDVLFSATGPDPAITAQNPSAISLSGSFKVQSPAPTPQDPGAVANHAFELDGATEASAATAIEAGNVRFDSRIQGSKDIDVTSHGVLELDDDVTMTGGAFGARGDGGVLLAGTGDAQSITAGSISLGNGAHAPKGGTASLVRDGDLFLDATTGSVSMGFGQALVVNGGLNVAATDTVTLADTAAKSIVVNSGHLAVYGGATVQANSISSTAKATVAGGGSATFAVPTGTEISSNVPSDQIVVRRLSANGQPIQIAMDTSELQPGQFPLVEVPEVTGAALFDYARLIPEPAVFHPLTQPHADRVALASAVEIRPLWAEELVAYLEQRSLEAPNETTVEDAELLPPVGARPGELLSAKDARVRSAAVENAVALYREVFRPELRRDPETGLVEAPDRSAEIRSAFQAPVDALRQQGRTPVEGPALAELIESDPRFAAAKADLARLTDLIDVGQRALAPDQQPRFRALVLAEITPHGIAPAEFERAFR